MPHRQEKVKACLEILCQKMEEYIQTHKEWHPKGYLCPHEGNPHAHQVMDEIIEDVKQAHDMLEAAMYAAGLDEKAMHNHGMHNPGRAGHAATTVARVVPGS